MPLCEQMAFFVPSVPYMAAVRGAPLRAPGSLILGLSTRVQLPPNLFDNQ